MNFSIGRLGLATALLVLAGAACAQDATTSDTNTGEAQDPNAAAAQNGEAHDTMPERLCLRETGSRIHAVRNGGMRDQSKGCLTANGRSYSREDLELTGEVDLGQALRKLDTSIR